MRYYVDLRIMEMVKETDIDLAFMAPETYHEYCDNKTRDIITEVWRVQKEDKTYGLLNISYTKDKPNYMIDQLRKNMFESNKVKQINLVRFEVPTEWFVNATKDL